MLLPEDGSRQPKHTGGKTAYFIYNLYVKTVDFNPWIIGWVQQIPILGPYLVLSGNGNNLEHLNLNRERFWYTQPISVFLNVFMNIELSNTVSYSLSLHI
jgi:hypothetical protein